MATKRVTKMVAFFDICDSDGQPIQLIDWQEVLADLEAERRTQGRRLLRQEIDDVRHYLQVYSTSELSHLVLAKEREEPPSSVDEESGEIVDEATDVNHPWVEVSIVSFLPGTNTFGFVLGTGASPRPRIVAEWLNKHGYFDSFISVQPHLSDELIERLADGSSEARLVTLRLGAPEIADLENSGGLYGATQQIGTQRELGPEINVEVTLTIDGRSDHASDGARRMIADLARGLLGRPLMAGKVEMVSVADGQVDKDIVDLVKFRMARRERVSVLDDEGHQVRIPSAVTAIARAASNLNIS